MKSRDEYTFQHSVSVAALAVAFGRVLEMPRAEIKELAMGGFLHDVGKAKVPGHILNKPGKLDDAEFGVMKTHATNTAELLRGVHGISEIAFNAASQHHERYDGTGYPRRLKGEEISLHGQALAIVDVYDAITSIRIYHKGMPPTEALRKLFEWGSTHFNPRLVQAFIKGIGIYPAGSLVRMESEKLGIVREVVPDKLLQPVVQLIYDCTKMCTIKPELVDLAASNDKIKSHESFEKWGINQASWHVAEAG
jgi:putative nucleotidyltransferase with HDIG domain